jgi:[ribosomal protein S18]-alanine N-acetyltransferase
LPANCFIKNKIASKTISFSFAAISDIDALLTIENQSFQSPWPRQHFQIELNQPYSFTLLARLPDTPNKEIAGYIIYWFVLDELHILNIAVKPCYRRQGIARGLINEVLRLARRREIKTAWLEVRPSNYKALSLYQSLGFNKIMTRKRYYSDTGEDALILTRSI